MEQKSTILIVDDEAFARSIIEGFLFREGYNLVFAVSGFEILAYLDKQLPDVILLDVMMPEMDGYTICQHLKSDQRWQHIPIILVTALSGKEDLVRGFEAGADDFLLKPVSELELRVRVRSMLRIKKQYDALQAALQLREDLAHMIVHDMRTPLTAILGYIGLLKIKDTIPPDDLEDLNKIDTQARRLSSFLNDILIVAKMEKAGQLIVNPSPVDVNQLVQQVVEDHRITAQLRRTNLIINLPAETKKVMLDTNLFHRVLDNLISNAIKFSPSKKAVTVQVDYLEPETELQLSAPCLRIRIRDEGPGIPEEHRDRIFNKFEVVALKRQDASQVGLGLVFCKMVVEAHGGRIYVEDNEPVGSIFTIEV